MTADNPILIVVSVIYLAIVLGVSIWGYFHTDTEEDFLAAGRSIGPWVGARSWRRRRSAPARSSARWAGTT